ncbi:MAG: putative quinol monooxygenase [Anaerolineae bacterium]
MITRYEDEIAIVAQFTAKDGRGAALLAEIYEVMGHTLAEPGCLRFVLHQSVDDPDLLTVVEKFASQKDFDAHLAQPYTKNLLEQVVPELVAVQNITFHKEVRAPEPVFA